MNNVNVQHTEKFQINLTYLNRSTFYVKYQFLHVETLFKAFDEASLGLNSPGNNVMVEIYEQTQ
jgi:hypothetical protein